MSEEKGITEAESPEQVAEADAPVRTRSNRNVWIALTAIVLSLAAIALAAWSAWSIQQLTGPAEGNARIDSLEERVEEIGSRFRDIDERFEQSDGAVADLDEQMADLRQRLGSVSDRHEDLEARLSALSDDLEQAVARLQRSAGEQRESDRSLDFRLNLIEASALLRMGLERVDLAGDFESARLAFRQAARRLEETEDSRVNRARRLVAGELEALEAHSGPDWAGIGGRLSRLASESEGWPARSGDEARPVAADAPDESDEAGWWASLKASMHDLVRIRERDATPVTEEQVDAVREQLRLRLLAAELAAVRGHVGELSRHAGEARDMVDRWFDAQDEAVAAALETLAEIAATDPPTPPRLGEGLEEIQQLLDES